MKTVRLPWPPNGLQPHAKGSWRPKAKATKAYRTTAWGHSLLAGVSRLYPLPTAILKFTYHPPDRRRRDVANMAIPMKAAIDGIADAMGCDDNGFRPRFPDAFAEPVKDGAVIVEISE